MFARRLALILALGTLTACASGGGSNPYPLRYDETAVIPGSMTAGMSGAEATRTVLVDAAHVAADHGYPYFRFVHISNDAPPEYLTTASVLPGTDATVKVFAADDVNPKEPGVWDAQKILSGVIAPTRAASYTPPATQPTTAQPDEPQSSDPLAGTLPPSAAPSTAQAQYPATQTQYPAYPAYPAPDAQYPAPQAQTPPAQSQKPLPRCTAYGCSW